MVKPLKDNATDEEKAFYEEKIKSNTPKASRIIVMVRHGQYNLDGSQDSERFVLKSYTTALEPIHKQKYILLEANFKTSSETSERRLRLP